MSQQFPFLLIDNDTYGHEMGDQVLKVMTRVAKEMLRESDLLVRWGGEEFLVVAPNTDATQGFALAESIRQAVEKTPVEGCHTVTVSMGMRPVWAACCC